MQEVIHFPHFELFLTVISVTPRMLTKKEISLTAKWETMINMAAMKRCFNEINRCKPDLKFVTMVH
jgi:hypothetical protein